MIWIITLIQAHSFIDEFYAIPVIFMIQMN